jgi:hypothetical protein
MIDTSGLVLEEDTYQRIYTNYEFYSLPLQHKKLENYARKNAKNRMSKSPKKKNNWPFQAAIMGITTR